MAKGLGSMGGATLQRSKLDLSKEVRTVAPRTDDNGGGGNIGKGSGIGGGGDGRDGDDDDYFDDFGEGDGDGDSENFFRTVIKQLYDAKSINAVLQEWFRTLETLPVGIKQFVAMGMVSSAQLVRLLSMDMRPSITRAVTRALPSEVSRGVVGRLMADPAFFQKLVIEEAITIGSSLYWEARQRGDRFYKELDFVAINTLCLAASTASLVWFVAPNRSYGATHKWPWQNMLHNLPNNAFDASGPARQYTMTSRMAGIAAKVGELSALGVASGTAMAGLGKLALALRRTQDPSFMPSVPVLEVGRSAGGFGASMGLFSNTRYQIIAGVDRYLFDHSVHLLPYLAASTVVRFVSNRLGEPTRIALQGLPTQFPTHRPTASRQYQSASTITFVEAPKPKRKARKGSKKAKREAKGFEMSGSVPAAATA
jgi:hypothetical protein